MKTNTIVNKDRLFRRSIITTLSPRKVARDMYVLFGTVPLCNKNKDRAPRIGEFVFPLCWRCSGVILGLFIAMLCRKVFPAMECIPLLFAMLLTFPLIIDGTTQYITKKESNNMRRFVTGILFSMGTAMISWSYVKILRFPFIDFYVSHL